MQPMGESGPKWFVDAWGQRSMVWLVRADTKRQQQVKCLAAYKLGTQMGHSRTLSQGCCSRQRTTATTTAHTGSVALGRERNRNEPAVMLSAVTFRWSGPNFGSILSWNIGSELRRILVWRTFGPSLNENKSGQWWIDPVLCFCMWNHTY